VDGGDAERQRAPSDIGETGAPHTPRELLGNRKIRDRLWQIPVCCAMSAHESADRRQDVIEVELITRVDEGRPRRRELEDDESRTGLEHAMHFAEAGIEISDVADSECYDRSGN
jgi:hypothetical protein